MKPGYSLHKLVFITSLLASMNGISQSKPKEVNTQYQSWFSFNTTAKISSRLSIMVDVHMRRNNFLADASFYFLRAGLSYQLTNNATATVGCAKMWVSPAQKGWHHFSEENRIFQQVQISNKVGRIIFINRIRNEQRWQQKILADSFTHHYKFTNRIRYLASLTIPVFKSAHLPSLAIADELAIQFGKEIVYNTFDQNRFFIGIKQPVNSVLSFDLGYMLIFQQKASGYQYDKNHTLRCFFYYTPNLMNHKKMHATGKSI